MKNMFPGGNANADLGYSKQDQFVAQSPHFLTTTVPTLAAPVMPISGIDWAQLAQQWIHMRDNGPANFGMPTMPIAPPPPIISNVPQYQHDEKHPKMRLEEHGEADMDMDEDNERAIDDNEMPPSPPVVAQSMWAATAGDSSGGVGVGVTTATKDAQTWNYGRGNTPTTVRTNVQNPTAHIPSLLKLNVSNPNEHSGGTINEMHATTASSIDANKRKMLPAWIREGLEKMEREKQRQLDRNQPRTPPPPDILQNINNVKQVSSKTLTTLDNILNISNAASDSDDSNAATDETATQLLGNEVISKLHNDDADNNDDDDVESTAEISKAIIADTNENVGGSKQPPSLSGKTYEERLADLMLVVRRTLTEILLETTREEIAAVAQETLAKASSAQVIRKSALSSITGNLGLAAYGDSSSESEDDDSIEAAHRSGHHDGTANDSDDSKELSIEELKAKIRKSKRAFEKVIEEIDERVAMQEERDEKKLQMHRKREMELLEQHASKERRHKTAHVEMMSSSERGEYASDSKMQHFNGKRLSRKERTTRFSDNKDQAGTASYVSQIQQQAVAAAASKSINSSTSSSSMPTKLQPVANPATNLLQMPESVASMLNAADKALHKAHKSVKSQSKHSRRRSTSSSSSGSSSSHSSDSSGSSSNCGSSTDCSSSRSSAARKRNERVSDRKSNNTHGTSSSRGSSSRRRDDHRSRPHSSRSKYEHRSYDNHRRDSRERDRDSRSRYKSNQHRRNRNESSGSDQDSSSYKRSSRHESSRSRRQRRPSTRSRSTSRGTHNSSSNASSHQRKRH